jgi:hypothetical protein
MNAMSLSTYIAAASPRSHPRELRQIEIGRKHLLIWCSRLRLRYDRAGFGSGTYIELLTAIFRDYY